ncbi:MAG: phosphatidylserine decarboxylase family protein [Bacteroidota bacterium]
MFAREGYPLIAAAIGIAAVLFTIGYLFAPSWLHLLLTAIGVLSIGFTLYFFRDPKRTPPSPADTLLLAPADGKVVEIVEEHEPLYLAGPSRRISIFLSPLNVHVNRAPADGVVEFDQYVPGEYLVAWHPKASEKNERSQLGIRHASGTPILFKQIAGAVARRIVYHITNGDTVKAGDRFGLVKFGSRMDVAVPPEVEFTVKIGDMVTAGETVIGHLPAKADA